MSIRLPPDLLAEVDARAAAAGESRAAVVRQLLTGALGVPRFGDVESGVDLAQIRRMLALTPRERIRHMAAVTNGIARFRERTRAGTA